MRRVLFIAYFYPPLANSGTQRPLKFANYLPDFGWDPLVLTVERPPDPQIDEGLLGEVRRGTPVTRVPMMSEIVGRAVGRSLSLVGDAGEVEAAVSWRLRRRFSNPDMYALWKPTAVRAGHRIFKAKGFDAIWATGFPWTSLLIGRDLARLTRRPLIADFRDPWTGEDLFEPAADRHMALRNRQLERTVLAQSSAVVGLAETVTAELRGLSPDSGSKQFATIPNGFDRHDLERSEPWPFPRKARVRLVYTGVWKAGYGLEPLYAAIRSLHQAGAITPQDLEVVAVGFPPGHAAELGVADYVAEPGPVPHASALGLMKSADVLFMPVAAGKRLHTHLPGKLYEYSASGRPIIAVADTPSEVHSFLRHVGGGIVLPPGDATALAETLRALCAGTGPLFPPLRADRLEAFERRSLTGALAALLEKVAAPQHDRCYDIETGQRIVVKELP